MPELDDDSTQAVVLLRPDATRLDALTAPAFRDEALPRAAGRRLVAIDVASVDFVDSTGLSCLIAVLKVLGPGGELRLAAPSAHLRAMLAVTRLDKLFRLFDSTEAALRG